MEPYDIAARIPVGLTPAADDAFKRYNHPGAVAAMIALSNPGSFTFVVAPVLLTAFLHSGGLSPSQAASLGAAELAGMTLATLAATPMVARFDRRLLAGMGLLVMFTGHILSIRLAGYGPIVAARGIAGFGVGTLFSVAVASLAGCANPDRAFGFSMTTNQVATLILMSVLARIGTNGGPSPIVLTIAIASAGMGLAIPFVPAHAPAVATRGRSADGAPVLLSAFLALGGTLAFNIAIGAVWPMAGQIGLSHGLPASVVNAALAMAGVGAIAAGALVAAIGARFGRFWPLMVCMTSLAVAMVSLHGNLAAGAFRATVSAFMFFWMLSVPFFLGTLAALDPRGCLAALSGAMLPCGMALGQTFAATVIAGGAFSRVILVGIVAVLTALILMALALRIASAGSAQRQLA